MTAPARVVDVHAHVIVPDIEAAVAGLPGLQAQRELDLRRNGATSAAASRDMVAARMKQLTDVDQRLLDMDTAGVDVQVLSVSPSQYHYWADEQLAPLVCRLANRGVRAFVDEAPARFTGLGLAPLQHPHLMVAALDDAVIECGLDGVEISSHATGVTGGTVELSDERLEPFWARAAELNAVIFVHPFGCTLDERLDRYYLANVVGQPTENAVALSHLIFSGVLDRHPTLRIVAAHGGGYLPTFIGRSDHAWANRPESRTCLERPSSYLSRIWFDSLVHTPQALAALADAVGGDRILLGSDYPFDMGVADPVQRVHEAHLDPRIELAILSETAQALGLTAQHPLPAVPVLAEHYQIPATRPSHLPHRKDNH